MGNSALLCVFIKLDAWTLSGNFRTINKFAHSRGSTNFSCETREMRAHENKFKSTNASTFQHELQSITDRRSLRCFVKSVIENWTSMRNHNSVVISCGMFSCQNELSMKKNESKSFPIEVDLAMKEKTQTKIFSNYENLKSLKYFLNHTSIGSRSGALDCTSDDSIFVKKWRCCNWTAKLKFIFFFYFEWTFQFKVNATDLEKYRFFHHSFSMLSK